MAVLPAITLTATLQDFTGIAVPNGVITIMLCNFGQTLPHIAGTSMLAQIKIRETLANGTTTGIKLYGNDQILPLEGDIPLTYYAISIEDNKRNIVQSGIYQFTGAQTIDLSNAPQLGIFPIPGLPNYFVEALAGNFPGNSYALSRRSLFNYLIGLYYNGVFQRPGVDYTFNQSASTVHLNFATEIGDNIYAAYISA